MTTAQGNSKQILVGAASVYIADAQPDGTSTSVPDLSTAIGSAGSLFDAATGWSHTGYTENGVEVSYEPTYGDVVVDQLLDSAVIFKTGMKVLVNTTFAEATLENLLVTWGAAKTDLNGNTLNINAGALGGLPTERGVAFIGPGPRNASGATVTERIYHVERAIQTQTTNHKLARDAATTLPVSFRCLPNDSASYGKVVDRAYATS